MKRHRISGTLDKKLIYLPTKNLRIWFENINTLDFKELSFWGYICLPTRLERKIPYYLLCLLYGNFEKLWVEDFII